MAWPKLRWISRICVRLVREKRTNNTFGLPADSHGPEGQLLLAEESKDIRRGRGELYLTFIPLLSGTSSHIL